MNVWAATGAKNPTRHAQIQKDRLPALAMKDLKQKEMNVKVYIYIHNKNIYYLFRVCLVKYHQQYIIFKPLFNNSLKSFKLSVLKLNNGSR